MPNPQDIFQLAQQTATQVTASPENWRRFLYTAAHNYHTTYLNQLLIHAQRPDATACATMKYWNEQAHRKVMYGSKSIIILQRHQGVPTAKRVFSMTDTVLTGDKAAAPWEVTDVIRPLLMQVNSVGSLMDRATEQVVSLSDRANRVLATSIEDSASRPRAHRSSSMSLRWRTARPSSVRQWSTIWTNSSGRVRPFWPTATMPASTMCRTRSTQEIYSAETETPFCRFLTVE